MRRLIRRLFQIFAILSATLTAMIGYLAWNYIYGETGPVFENAYEIAMWMWFASMASALLALLFGSLITPPRPSNQSRRRM